MITCHQAKDMIAQLNALFKNQTIVSLIADGGDLYRVEVGWVPGIQPCVDLWLPSVTLTASGAVFAPADQNYVVATNVAGEVVGLSQTAADGIRLTCGDHHAHGVSAVHPGALTLRVRIPTLPDGGLSAIQIVGDIHVRLVRALDAR